MSIIYEVFRNGESFALKTLSRNLNPSKKNPILLFRKEAAALARLNHPSLVRVIEVNEVQGLPYLVMELVKGKTLADVLSDGSLSESQLISIARDLASALIEVHGRGIVHRDINPANIIIQPNFVPKIVDFGFAEDIVDAKGSREKSAVLDEIMGTFLYSAPEQTGMLNRPVDRRSDLYALGCLLFECAVGYPPFKASSSGELLQKHLTSKPDKAHEVNKQISLFLSRIIEKLMAKDPDDRYQSARGLLGDLEVLLNSGEEKQLSSISLDSRSEGGADSGIQIPLVGRSREMNLLNQYWEQAKAGRGGVVQIEGPAGSGKTRLVQELVKAAQKDGWPVLIGKAQQAENLPMGPLREAFNVYINFLQILDENSRLSAIQKLREAAGEFAPLIKRISKKLESVLEAGLDLPLLDPKNEQERFFEKVTDFFIQWARDHGAAILVLDDIQWLEDSTLEVVKRLSSQISFAPLLIVTTSRNDTQSEPARRNFLKSVGSGFRSSIDLKSLDIDAVKELISAYLGGRSLQPHLVEKLATKTEGNPFVLKEFIQSLLENGLLRPERHHWVIEDSQLHKLDLSINVIQLLIERIQSLEPEVRKVLSVAAVIGFDFEPQLLTQVVQLQKEQIHTALAEGIRFNLLEKSDFGYSFVHDRVFEAFIGSLESHQLKQIHQNIAECLEMIQDNSMPHLYALAEHYANGNAEQLANKRRICETSYQVGKHALESFANEEAFKALERAFRVGLEFKDPGAELNPLREVFATAAMRVGRLELAHELVSAAMKHVSSKGEKARFRYLSVEIYSFEGKTEHAWKELQKTLFNYDKRAAIPRSILAQVFCLLRHWMSALVRIHFPRKQNKVSQETLTRRRMLATIYNNGNFLAYFLGNPWPFVQNIIRQLHNVQFLGLCSDTAKAYVFYSIALSLMRLKRAAYYYGNLSLTLAKQIGDREAVSSCEFYFACTVEIIGEFQKGQDMAVAAVPNALKYLNAWEKAGLLAHLETSFDIQGKSRTLIDWSQRYLPIVRQCGAKTFESTFISKLYVHLRLLGRIAEAAEVEVEMRKLQEETAGIHFCQASFCGAELLMVLDQEDFGPKAEDWIKRFLDLNYHDYHTRSIYILICYIRLEQLHLSRSEKDRDHARKRLKSALSKALFPPLLCNPPQYRAHILVLKAAIALESKNFKKAWILLGHAEMQADLAGSYWAKWTLEKQRARTAVAQNNIALAGQYARRAFQIASEQGWVNRARQLKQEFSFEMPFTAVKLAETTLVLSHSRRYLDALLQVSLASSTSLDPLLQAKAVLDELVSTLGAERAFLFVEDENFMNFRFFAGRNSDKQDLKALKGYSETVIALVRNNKKPIIVTGTEEGEALGSQSIVAKGLRSIIATPLLLRERFLGVVYLDSRLAKGIFTEEHIALLTALSNHIAIALETAQMVKLQIERTEFSNRLELAHLAGMAEIVRGVLHNIGNTLTSVSVTSEFISESLKRSNIESFIHASALLESHKDHLLEFINQDSKGILLLKLLAEAGPVLVQEKKELLKNAEAIRDGISIVKQTIATQTRYAGFKSESESIHIGTLLDELLSPKEEYFLKNGIQLQKKFTERSRVNAQRNKLLQIFLCLIENAKKMIEESSADRRILSISTSEDDQNIIITLSNSGAGISKEDLNSLFNQNFSINEKMSGFEFHLAAISIQELGGKIFAESPGVNLGSTFTILIPKQIGSYGTN